MQAVQSSHWLKCALTLARFNTVEWIQMLIICHWWSVQVKWMMYWIVFAIFSFVEVFADILISWQVTNYNLYLLFYIGNGKVN